MAPADPCPKDSARPSQGHPATRDVRECTTRSRRCPTPRSARLFPAIDSSPPGAGKRHAAATDFCDARTRRYPRHPPRHFKTNCQPGSGARQAAAASARMGAFGPRRPDCVLGATACRRPKCQGQCGPSRCAAMRSNRGSFMAPPDRFAPALLSVPTCLFRSDLLGHRLPRNPARGPCGLEIESAGDAIYVEQFAGKMESGTNPALHGLEIHLAQTHAAAGDEFVLVRAFAGYLEFSAN